MSYPSILLVEDDPTLGYALSEYLALHDFRVDWQKDGVQAAAALQRGTPYDLCVLDVMIPHKDGFTLAQEIKAYAPRMPIMFLTARSLKIDKLRGFHLGADDYLVKPIDEEELVARIQAVLRRSRGQEDGATTYTIGEYSFDRSTRRLSRREHIATLTEKEADLLCLLCQRKNQLLDRKETLRQLWGSSDYFNRRSMDVHIAKLRKYLRADRRVQITNVHGKGFILEEINALL